MPNPIRPPPAPRRAPPWWLWPLLWALTACGGGVIQRIDEAPAPPPGLAWLEIRADPADVEIYVDGAFRGRLDGYPRGVLPLRPGPRRVVLRKAGLSPHYALVELGVEGGKLQARLVPEVPEVPEAGR